MPTLRTLPALVAPLLTGASVNAAAPVEQAMLWLLTWQQVLNGSSQRLTFYTRDEPLANQIEVAHPDRGGPNAPRRGMGHCTSQLPNTVLVDRLVPQSDPAVRADCDVFLQPTPLFDTPIHRWRSNCRLAKRASPRRCISPTKTPKQWAAPNPDCLTCTRLENRS